MKVKVMAVGRLQQGWVSEGLAMYAGRLGRYLPGFELVEVPDVKASRSLPESRQKELEGEALLARVAQGDTVVLLDERGRQMTSRQLAADLERRLACGAASKALVYVVGGPYGFSEAVYARADARLALSLLTFPHEVARLLLCEQLYRAVAILHGLPYHHD